MLRRLRISNLVLIEDAELELDEGLNAITGETGAGKTILAGAFGLLLGARGDAALIGAAGDEAYVEAEFDAAADEELGPLAELRPEGEDGLVLARRVFADGRTRAYAWGRAAAREDVAAAAEALVAMSGQFEQRRLARAAYRLGALDGFAGLDLGDARAAWRRLQAARRRHRELTEDAAGVEARLAELRALAEDTEGLAPGREDELRIERERLRHIAELASAAEAGASALAPDDGEGASDLVAAAERALQPVEHLEPELRAAGDVLRQAELQLRETASELRRVLTSLEADPGRLEHAEEELDRIAGLRRRFRVETYAELVERGVAARTELAALEEGHDPVEAAAAELEKAETEVGRIHEGLTAARAAAATPFSEAVAAELAGLGLGEGEFHVELRPREPGPTGADEVEFLIRPNAGLPPAPVSETASGGELSRIALALAAVAGGETLVFDEIDAGVGGTTAHAVGETLRRLAGRAQVITITHLPQIASLADRHFRVEKAVGDPTRTHIDALDDAERRDELERMLGGAEFLASLDERR
ncbi:MAG TPA: AAA family ATPase [Gaiellaceae bacterium]|jgi:DNA repair protein RecN (Recombination protein N)